MVYDTCYVRITVLYYIDPWMVNSNLSTFYHEHLLVYIYVL